MFEDKTMVADTLAGINGELMRFGEMIPQTENKELKTTLKQFRSACEQSQEELYQIAREKSYYVPAAEFRLARHHPHQQLLVDGLLIPLLLHSLPV